MNYKTSTPAFSEETANTSLVLQGEGSSVVRVQQGKHQDVSRNFYILAALCGNNLIQQVDERDNVPMHNHRSNMVNRYRLILSLIPMYGSGNAMNAPDGECRMHSRAECTLITNITGGLSSKALRNEN